MKIRLEDLEKSIKWIRENTHNVVTDITLDFNRHLKLKCEDKYQRITEITIYSVDKDQRSLLKPTIQKTEQL